VQNFSQIRSAVWEEMHPRQTDRQTDTQTTNSVSPHYHGIYNNSQLNGFKCTIRPTEHSAVLIVDTYFPRVNIMNVFIEEFTVFSSWKQLTSTLNTTASDIIRITKCMHMIMVKTFKYSSLTTRYKPFWGWSSQPITGLVQRTSLPNQSVTVLLAKQI